MLKRLISFTMLSLLISCGEPRPKQGADGYVFGQRQYEKSVVHIEIVTYQTRAELIKAAKDRGVTDPGIVAFSVLRPPTFDRCTIHMVDPSVSYDPEFMGHELAHCVYGQWHTDNNSFR